VIYCVIPEPLADELYPRLSSYYEDDPNVEVIIDRRQSERRSGDERRTDPRADEQDDEEARFRREQRDRRRARVPGEFPPVDPATV
jgi:hypothetical protein